MTVTGRGTFSHPQKAQASARVQIHIEASHTRICEAVRPVRDERECETEGSTDLHERSDRSEHGYTAS
tara:strand:- start:766 stop:969 length:204 start_codon:yes stop_codon:yes gene_type:complete